MPGFFFVEMLLNRNSMSCIDLGLFFMLILLDWVLIVCGFQEFVHFFYVIKFISMVLFLTFPCYPCIACSMCMMSPTLISAFSLSTWLSILLNFKNQLFVSFTFFTGFSVSYSIDFFLKLYYFLPFACFMFNLFFKF